MAIDPNSIAKDLRPLSTKRMAIPVPSINAPVSADHLGNSPRSGLLFYPAAPIPDPNAATAAAAAFPPLGFSNPILPVVPTVYPIQLAANGCASPAPAAGPVPDQVVAEDGVEDQSLSKKVKFLCSFGGKILPRPSDAALRYVGGQTRIISVRKDASFQELMQKMVDTYGGPVVLKYQLPDEDLDALVSVSCPEDLENMMEEYEKLAESSQEGSAKLRVFLFSPSELDPSGLNQLSDLNDTSQRYVDAVNGIPEYGLRRKDSTVSASSTQNSDGVGGDTMDGGTEGMSPAILSPTVAATSQDASKFLYVGAPTPVVFPESTGIPVNVTGGLGVPPPQTLTSSRVEPPAVAAYLPHAYVDPHQDAFNRMHYLHNPSQIQYMNPQHVGLGGAPVSLVALPSQSYMHTVHINPSLSTAQVNSATPIQPRGGESYLEESSFGGRVLQLPVDPSYKTYHGLSQLPPLPPSSPQPQSYEQYGWRQGPPPPQPQRQQLRVEDCHMCQKALPHAHSDTLVQEQGSASMVSVTEPGPMFHSLHSEDAIRSRVPQRAVTAAMTNGIVENLVESMVSAPQVGTHGYSQISNTQFNNEMVALQKDNVDKGRAIYPPGGVGLPSDVQGMFVNNFSLSPHGDTLQKPLPPQYLSKQDILMSKPISSEFTQTRNGVLRNLETPILDYGSEFSYDHGRPIQEMMGALKVTASETPVINEQWKTIKHNLGESGPVNGMMEMGHMCSSEDAGNSEQWGSAIKPIVSAPKDLRPESSALLSETVANVKTHVGGKEMLSSNAFVIPAITQEGNSLVPINQMQCSSLEATHLHNPQVAKSTQVTPVLGNPGLYHHRLENIGEPPIPHERLLGVAKATNKTPVGDQEDEASWFQSRNAFNEVSAPPSSTTTFTLSNASSPNGYVGDVLEPYPSDSLFSNADPWRMAQNTHLPSQKPKKVDSRESLIPSNSWNETRLRKSGDSEAAVLLAEGDYHQPSDPLNKDSWPELIKYKKGSEDENIKKELQAVAEGVAASVFESSTPPVPSIFAHETNRSPPESNKERAFNMDNVELSVDHDSELEKTNLGLQITEDIGRLQIIRNRDLEELRELGSGTFGTVYHGKWRGSDVAIKRINDRCFAGKPSEQERLRSDFWNEACKLADLHHPNVVAFYGVVLDGPGGSIATVTEYMVNGSLRHALQRNDKTLDRRKRLIIAMDVAFGMEYLHGKNIVHFDLKSDNLLVNLRDPQRPICKVGDLGLSKVKCQTLISGGVRGTLPWMAPELLNGSSSLVSEKVDVFSFGIVMWELLTGEEPYADLHYGAIIGGIVSNTLRPPVPESCDPDWRSLMEDCWSSEPSERPSFTEIANRLRSVSFFSSPKRVNPTKTRCPVGTEMIM